MRLWLVESSETSLKQEVDLCFIFFYKERFKKKKETVWGFDLSFLSIRYKTLGFTESLNAPQSQCKSSSSSSSSSSLCDFSFWFFLGHSFGAESIIYIFRWFLVSSGRNGPDPLGLTGRVFIFNRCDLVFNLIFLTEGICQASGSRSITTPNKRFYFSFSFQPRYNLLCN